MKNHSYDLRKILILEYKIGSIPLKCLMDYYHKDIEQIIEYLESHYDFKISKEDQEEIESNLKYMESRGIHPIPFFSEYYPRRLACLLNSPVMIFGLGNLELLKKPLISVVGTRQPTEKTIEFTRLTAKTLVRNGFCVVSGMANGVDSVAHEESLPFTIGILPSGFNKLGGTILPMLMEKNSLLISRFIGKKSIEKWHFLHRNSLIAGISPTTCIMECKTHSGTMDTAKKASYYNNNVLVATAHPLDQSFAGNIELLKKGAIPLVDPELIPYSFNVNEPTYKFKLDINNIIPLEEFNSDVWHSCKIHGINSTFNSLIHYKLLNKIDPDLVV